MSAVDRALGHLAGFAMWCLGSLPLGGLQALGRLFGGMGARGNRRETMAGQCQRLQWLKSP